MNGAAENCLLTHKLEDGYEIVSFSLTEQATGANAAGKSIRLTVGTDDAGRIDDLQIGHGELNFQSLTLSEKIIMEAEAKLDQLSDDEYIAEQEKAEAVEGQSVPGFAAFTASAGGEGFSVYASNVRAAEKFPELRSVDIDIVLNDIAVYEVSEGATVEAAGVQYKGPCTVAIVIE